MGNLYARIETMCHNKGVSITDMCRESSASRGSLSDLKMGRISSLTAGTLSKLSAYFGVSIDVLIGNDELQPIKTAGKEEQKKTALQTESGNENEKEFMNLFLKLSPEEQLRELSYLRELVGRKDM